MKKSVMVIYYPIELGAAEPVLKANHKLIRQDLDDMKKRDIANNFDVVVIEDYHRDKVEVEVIFNPYQE
jgi:hypothetical protein